LYLVFELDKLSDTRKILEKSQGTITEGKCCKNSKYNPAFWMVSEADVVEDVVKDVVEVAVKQQGCLHLSAKRGNYVVILI
jgi:hypothetical protein